jgi:predicted transcriptional regulator
MCSFSFIFDFMRVKFLLLVWLLMFANVQSVKAQNSDIHQNTRIFVGATAVVGAGIFIYESFKFNKSDAPNTTVNVDSSKVARGELYKTLRSSRRATAVALGAGALGGVFINSGNLPLALAFTGVSAVSSVVAVVQKIKWENRVTKKLEQL